MRLLAIAALTTALGCLAQAQPIAVPAGTKIPLTLTSPLGTRTARVGDSVRAVTAFPVAVSGHVAIPVGTSVEGAVDQVTRHGRHAGFEMHFTRIIFDNGYTVPLSASSTAVLTASLSDPGLPHGTPSGTANSLQAFPVLPQQSPTLTAPSTPGPDKGLIIGLGAAGVATAVVAAVVFGHRGGGLYLDVGSPLDMVLAGPLSLDAAKLPAVAAAVPDSR